MLSPHKEKQDVVGNATVPSSLIHSPCWPANLAKRLISVSQRKYNDEQWVPHTHSTTQWGAWLLHFWYRSLEPSAMPTPMSCSDIWHLVCRGSRIHHKELFLITSLRIPNKSSFMTRSPGWSASSCSEMVPDCVFNVRVSIWKESGKYLTHYKEAVWMELYLQDTYYII